MYTEYQIDILTLQLCSCSLIYKVSLRESCHQRDSIPSPNPLIVCVCVCTGCYSPTPTEWFLLGWWVKMIFLSSNHCYNTVVL